MFHHDIHLAHTRHPIATTFTDADASSAISISVDSNDLVEAMTELLSRLPEDLKTALQIAFSLANK